MAGAGAGAGVRFEGGEAERRRGKVTQYELLANYALDVARGIVDDLAPPINPTLTLSPAHRDHRDHRYHRYHHARHSTNSSTGIDHSTDVYR